jgi:hypothetical protein
MSKGHAPRKQRDDKAYADNWSKIFGKKNQQHLSDVPASLIEGIMSTETCGHPFCDCKDVCKEAK